MGFAFEMIFRVRDARVKGVGCAENLTSFNRGGASLGAQIEALVDTLADV